MVNLGAGVADDVCDPAAIGVERTTVAEVLDIGDWGLRAFQDPEVTRFLERIAPFAETLNEAVLIGGSGCVIFYANQEYCRLAGRSRSELIGRTVFDFLDEEARRRLAEILSSQPRTETHRLRYEYFIVRSDGLRVPVHVAVAPLQMWDAPPGLVIVTITDLSELKRAQETIALQTEMLRRHAENLEQEVQRRTLELYEANFDAIYMLAVASEVRDKETGNHVRRIQHMSEAIAVEMGLPLADAVEIGYSALLHDVGKVNVPDRILKKAGPLNAEERELVKSHTVEGERILGERPFFNVARHIARSHHEDWDGSGYPDGLRGEDIPLPARIVAVADVYDALKCHRVYKPAWPHESVIQTLKDMRETKFDPKVLKAFLSLDARGQITEVCDLVDGQSFEWRPPSSDGIPLPKL
ncbi:HD domain-containing protein [Candidatus Poribacteria bacterium]|nr:HD domain-containing protein [Candidatus Poribacteria bacterium]